MADFKGMLDISNISIIAQNLDMGPDGLIAFCVTYKLCNY